jgi:hypothetical protein
MTIIYIWYVANPVATIATAAILPGHIGTNLILTRQAKIGGTVPG